MFFDFSKPSEIFKSLDFLGFPDYRVGDWGSVWSRRGRGFSASLGRTRPWTKLRITKNKNYGHCSVCMSNEFTKSKRFYVHRLVLLAFVGDCPEGMEGCHNNRDTSNNRLDNLRWDYPKGNADDKIKHGTKLQGEKCSSAILTEKEVLEIRQLHGKMSQYKIADLYGVGRGCIQRIVERTSWRHI